MKTWSALRIVLDMVCGAGARLTLPARQRGNGHTAVKLTLQELAYRGLAARFCRSCSNPPLKAKHAMPDKTTGLLHRLLSYADFQGASYSWAHPAFVLLLIFQPMASGYGFQVFLRIAIQNQIGIAQRVIIDEIV